MPRTKIPRTLVVSQRGLDSAPHRSLACEVEDVVVRLDGAHLLAPTRLPPKLPPPIRKLVDRMERSTGLSVRLRAPVTRVELDRDYDLLLVVAQRARDLEILDAVVGWEARCARKVALIEELWTHDVAPSSKFLRHLTTFDHVMLGVYNSVPEAQKRIGRHVEYMAPAVDTLSFCPRPGTKRCIDVYAMGRRAPATHRALLEMAERGEIFYLYDSGWPTQVPSPAEHRRLLGSIVGRSRYFLVNPAKCNRPQDTGGQVEVGLRFFEGAAAGAVMLGEVPEVPSFDEHFDWPDAVLPMAYDESDVASVLERYDAEPERLARAGSNNVVNALLRHDVVYRWERICAAVGLKARAPVAERKRALVDRARLEEETSKVRWVTPPRRALG